MDTYIPFCGAPPLPAELWSRWTLEPTLLIGLALVWVLGWRIAENRLRFAMAWGLVTVLFVSPLCAASIALFSARVGQHILLTLVAAPLLAAALPRLRWPPLPFAALFAGLFWVWHAPAPYQATLESDGAYWAMHISLFAAATLLFATMRARPERALPAAALTGAQLTLYATLLTLAPAAWHGWHIATTPPYGLTALADQQLAGALMWVAGGALFLTSIANLTLRFFRDTHPDRPTS
ncbi:cytochrome c oxidase assembly protein [Roseicyclus elongatus]|nr:cytochrome c oxidase assembly protein [Roseibacterium elongatum]